MRSHLFVKRNISPIVLALTIGFSALPSYADFQLTPPAELTADASNTPDSTQESFESKLIRSTILEISVKGNNTLDNASALRFSASASKQDNVNTPTHSEIKARFTESGLNFEYLYDAQALANPKQLVVDMAFMKFVTNTPANAWHVFSNSVSSADATNMQLRSPYALAELIFNAENGSPTAAVRMLEYQIKSLENLHPGAELPVEIEINSFIQETMSLKKQQLAEMKTKAQAYTRQQEKALREWKEKYQAQEKYEAMEQKLNDLILNNDRKGVARMIEAYLPWAIMEPFETQSWKTWISAIEKPDTKNTTVAFRGVSYNTDKIQRKQTAKGEVFGFMSTVLTKNQGSYTRRLRSLSTNRVKNGDIGLNQNQTTTQSVKIFDQLSAHAANPVASSFLSFTYNPKVAVGFSGGNTYKVVDGVNQLVPAGGLLAVKMDSRRLFPNIASGYAREIELLAPLIVFPDEIVKYSEGERLAGEALDAFIQEVGQKSGVDFTAPYNLHTAREKFNRDGYKFFENIVEQLPTSKQNPRKAICAKVF